MSVDMEDAVEDVVVDEEGEDARLETIAQSSEFISSFLCVVEWTVLFVDYNVLSMDRSSD